MADDEIKIDTKPTGDKKEEKKKKLPKGKIIFAILGISFLGYLGYKGFSFIQQRLEAEKTGQVVNSEPIIDIEKLSAENVKKWIDETLMAYINDHISMDFIFSIDGFNYWSTVAVGIICLYFSFKDHLSYLSGNHIDYKGPIVSFGVLGTFGGIFLGLFNFDVADIDGSIPELLGGLQTAFLTSIMSLVASIVLAIMQVNTGDGEDGEVVKQETELSYLKELSRIFTTAEAHISKLPDINKLMSENLGEIVKLSKANLDRTTNLERNLNEMKATLTDQALKVKELQREYSENNKKSKKSSYDDEDDY